MELSDDTAEWVVRHGEGQGHTWGEGQEGGWEVQGARGGTREPGATACSWRCDQAGKSQKQGGDGSMTRVGTIEREGPRGCRDDLEVLGHHWGMWGAGRRFGVGLGTSLAWCHLEQVISLCLSFFIYKMGIVRANPYPQEVP